MYSQAHMRFKCVDHRCEIETYIIHVYIYTYHLHACLHITHDFDIGVCLHIACVRKSVL
jgi:hypothetical protein